MGMNALDINFAKSHRRVSCLSVAMLVIAIGALVGVSWSYDQALTELQELEVRARRLQTSAAKSDKADRGSQTMAVDVLMASTKAMAQLQHPWGEVLDQIAQAAKHQRIAVLSLDADGGSRTVRLSAHARDFSHTLAFIEELKRSRWLAGANLIGHEIAPALNGPGVRFSAELTWRPVP